MTTVSQHAPGTFCWIQLGTTDEEGARKFYSGLFGWNGEKTTVEGGSFTLVKKKDKAIGAVMQQGPEQGPPSWTPFVAVKNVDQVADTVRTKGGKVLMEPMNASTNGRFGVFADPTGAVFAAWQAGTKAGAEVMGETSSVCWNELITTDSSKAGAFYENVFGWKAEATPMPGQKDRTYTIFQKGTEQAGGMMSATPEMHLTHPYWMIYFAVDDTDKSAAKAEQLGAKVMMKPTDIPTIGRFAVIKDPQGAWFSILKPQI
jgi:predicted enzyme related to lactoylglutathione lyase